MSTMNGQRTQAQSHHRAVNVAILGAGNIANAMALTLNRMADDPRYANLVAPYAVAARDGDRAAAFARQYGIPVSYGSYEELADDPDVDLIYIATPHSLHAQQALMCLACGKNILMEKAFTANARQAQAVFDAADQAGLLCTEAIWTRYMPSRTMINELLDSGVIGDIRTVSANLAYATSHKARITNPELAGGALLDVGVYALNFIDMVMRGRDVDQIATSMMPYATGVDAQSSTMLRYGDDVMATADCSMLAYSDRGGYIWGTNGYLVCTNINDVESIDVYDTNHQLLRHVTVPEQLTGYEYEVIAAANAILDGRTQCADMPHEDTLRMMRLMDRIRGAWGLRYPFE